LEKKIDVYRYLDKKTTMEWGKKKWRFYSLKTRGNKLSNKWHVPTNSNK
jgi:hypothetical protein